MSAPAAGSVHAGGASEPAAEVEFGLADLPALRRVVMAAAGAVGFNNDRATELALAINEITTNAIVHGAPPAKLRVWTGNGIWRARRLCDTVEIRNSVGCTVTRRARADRHAAARPC